MFSLVPEGRNITLPFSGDFNLKFTRSLKKVVSEIIEHLNKLYFPDKALTFWMYHSYDLHLYNYFPVRAIPVDEIISFLRNVLHDRSCYDKFKGYIDYIQKNYEDPHDIINYRLLKELIFNRSPQGEVPPSEIVKRAIEYVPVKIDDKIFQRPLKERRGIWYSLDEDEQKKSSIDNIEDYIFNLFLDFNLIPHRGYVYPVNSYGQIMGFVIIEMDREDRDEIFLLENYLHFMFSHIERTKEIKFIRQVILSINRRPQRNFNEIILENIHFTQNLVMGLLFVKEKGIYKLLSLKKFAILYPVPYMKTLCYDDEPELFRYFENNIISLQRDCSFSLDSVSETEFPDVLLKEYSQLAIKPLSRLSVVFSAGMEEYMFQFYYVEKPEHLMDNLNSILRIISHVYTLYELHQELLEKEKKAEWEKLSAGISHSLTKIVAIARSPVECLDVEELIRRDDLSERLFQSKFYLEKLRKRINFIHKASGRRFKKEEFEELNIWRELLSAFKDAWNYYLMDGDLKKYEVSPGVSAKFPFMIPPVLVFNGSEYIFYDEVNEDYLKKHFSSGIFIKKEKRIPEELFKEKPVFTLPGEVFSAVFEEIFINAINYSEPSDGFIIIDLKADLTENNEFYIEIRNSGKEYKFYLTETGKGWGLYVIKYFFEEVLGGHIEKTYGGGKNILKLTFNSFQTFFWNL